MAVALVQDIGTAGTDTGTTTAWSGTKTITEGNTIVVAVGYYAATATDSIADNLGNTYTLVERKAYGSNVAALYTAPVTTGGSLTAITVTHPSSGYANLVAAEFSGVGDLATAGAGTSGTGTTATWDANKTIPADGAAFGAVANTNNRVLTAGSDSGDPSTAISKHAQENYWYSTGLFYAIADDEDVTGFTGTATLASSADWSGAGGNFEPGLVPVVVTPTTVALTLTTYAPTVTGTSSGTYFISPTGNDTTGAGTISSPWRTIGRFLTTARDPDDILYCRGGTYTGTNAVLIGAAAPQDGTDGHPITIAAYPGETPVFVGPSTNGYGSFLFISWGTSYLVIDGLQTTASFNTNEFSLCDIGQTAGRTTPVTNIVVRNCVVRGKATGSQSAHGIYISEYAEDITIEDNTIIGPYPGQSDALTGAGIEVYHSPSPTGLLIQRNVIVGWSEGIQLWDEAATKTLTAEILHNTFLDNNTNIDARYHSTLLIRDNAGEQADSNNNLYDPNNSAATTADHNYWDQGFDATYRLLPGETGIDGALDGSDAGAFDIEPGATEPDPPTGVYAVAGNGAAFVYWTAPVDDGGSAITLYTVTSSPGGLTGTNTQPVAGVMGLTNDTAYTFTVVATNAVGDSDPSAASVAVTPTAPAEPISLHVEINEVDVTENVMLGSITATRTYSGDQDSCTLTLKNARPAMGYSLVVSNGESIWFNGFVRGLTVREVTPALYYCTVSGQVPSEWPILLPPPPITMVGYDYEPDNTTTFPYLSMEYNVNELQGDSYTAPLIWFRLKSLYGEGWAPGHDIYVRTTVATWTKVCQEVTVTFLDDGTPVYELTIGDPSVQLSEIAGIKS